MSDYYRTALVQARMSFGWAVAGAAAGLCCFAGAVAVQLWMDATNAAGISAVAGAFIEVIAGLNFVLYGKATVQLGEFHERLERIQRFALASRLCDSLPEESRAGARAELIRTVSGDTAHSRKAPVAWSEQA
ncbi:MAG TPA: hypothetical protein VF712_06155 [Thermoleophilaceae bacterium]